MTLTNLDDLSDFNRSLAENIINCADNLPDRVTNERLIKTTAQGFSGNDWRLVYGMLTGDFDAAIRWAQHNMGYCQITDDYWPIKAR